MYLEWNLRFNKKILKKGLELYGGYTDNCKELMGRQNVIYSFRCSGKEYIIRFSSSLRRSIMEIEAELDWIFFLHNNEISVSKPIYSKYNNLVEVVDGDGIQFYVVVFEKAKGIYVANEFRTKKMFFLLGKYVGKMHCLTKKYNPSEKIWKRPHWYNSKLFDFINMNIPQRENKIHEIFNETICETKKLVIDSDSYGLIHSDIHYRNFNIMDDTITLFDFDDCEYGWFVKDISNIIFYTYVENYSSSNKENDMKIFLINFFKGYYEENDLDDRWILKLPLFLKIREIVMYAMLYDWKKFTHCSVWVSEFMKERKNFIEESIPTIREINFNDINI
ncbi:hypothetical protein FDC22_10900 [Clostridium botulinum]|uniref:Aminoglycoside phosphotransferase domain-containing protein n=1 Tax=Clostridium botulinum (strain Okra / Type B1) TaxID=498213 RepID=B1IK69_CLOBK|nr:phosphotransferase [Clostridium botulinum]EKX78708.1 hypothetical protein CFSAN001628_017659 [Clostridium botulinum CFSAN001628]ACA44429.1 conserved hypothetical protein [Clostridium botulinum B1 str. Okra]MBD5562700.1 phosphotransferase [Clostridium botulinum]MBD5565859.1 phosphotransferase [Clostridium botulinum]MBD5569623.1 phosphotransferase [Clostridium botulinum]